MRDNARVQVLRDRCLSCRKGGDYGLCFCGGAHHCDQIKVDQSRKLITVSCVVLCKDLSCYDVKSMKINAARLMLDVINSDISDS